MVKERNPILVILFTVLSCGIYGMYWMYDTSRELNEKGVLEYTPGKMLLFLLLAGCTCGITGFIALWKYSEAIEKLSKGEKTKAMLFILALFFAPGFYYLAQAELNKYATPAAA